MCVPSIVIYNIVVLSFVSLIKVVKPFNVSYVSLCKKKTMYTLLRSPFVDKKSREQMLVNNFVGVLNIKVGIKHILLFEYFEFFLKDLVLSIVYTKCCILKNIYIL